jgi:hypothetical protein
VYLPKFLKRQISPLPKKKDRTKKAFACLDETAQSFDEKDDYLPNDYSRKVYDASLWPGKTADDLQTETAEANLRRTDSTAMLKVFAKHRP